MTTATTSFRHTDSAHAAHSILWFAFTVLPIIAGLDKFFHVLTNWSVYLAPQLARLSPLAVDPTMRVIGVIEIVAGLIVAFVPRVGSWIIAIWLAAIIVNLLLLGSYFDIALRDFALLLAAVAFGRLTEGYRVRQTA